MNCIKTIPFLFFWTQTIVKHDYKIWSIGKFMSCSTDFVVNYRCNKCGAIKEEHFVSWDSLLLKGVKIEDIKEACNKTLYFE